MRHANVALPWNSWGRHRAACSQSGRLRTRAVAPERTLARVCREARAILRTNVKLRDMNIAVRADDGRCIEVVASGLPLFHGCPIGRGHHVALRPHESW